MVERNLSGREAEARRAEALLDHELERFQRWLETLDVVPTIAALHERGDAIVRQVLSETRRSSFAPKEVRSHDRDAEHGSSA